jgi:hypothetical protein
VATDSSGQSTSVSVPVNVVAAVPFTLTVTAPSGRINIPLTITATPQPGAPEILAYSWDFGDGTTATTTIGAVPHTYTSIIGASQQFVVTVIAKGADGRNGVGSAIATITQ